MLALKLGFSLNTIKPLGGWTPESETSALAWWQKATGVTTEEGKLTDWIDQGTADVIRRWRKQCYDPETGRVGIKAQYAKEGVIYLYAPGGEAEKPTVSKQWRLFNIWPVSVSWGALDMTASEKIQIEVQMVYDKALPVPKTFGATDLGTGAL